MSVGALHLLAAFTTTPEGGNPAGVWIGDQLPRDEEMLAVARRVGFSETAFLVREEGTRYTVRYYSPEAEVPFCGHATIAAGVKLGELQGEGRYLFQTAAGDVPVEIRMRDGRLEATLTSVTPRHTPASKQLLDEVLTALRWSSSELDASIPSATAFAGAWHLVIAASSADRLAHLDYDFDGLKRIMLEAGLTTLQLVWRESPTLFHSRNPFPVGGVVEDPATGAAAAALGGYLRDAALIDTPATITIRQGEAMGRPGRILVEIPEQGGIRVTGTAVAMSSSIIVAEAEGE